MLSVPFARCLVRGRGCGGRRHGFRQSFTDQERESGVSKEERERGGSEEGSVTSDVYLDETQVGGFDRAPAPMFRRKECGQNNDNANMEKQTRPASGEGASI